MLTACAFVWACLSLTSTLRKSLQSKVRCQRAPKKCKEMWQRGKNWEGKSQKGRFPARSSPWALTLRSLMKRSVLSRPSRRGTWKWRGSTRRTPSDRRTSLWTSWGWALEWTRWQPESRRPSRWTRCLDGWSCSVFIFENVLLMFWFSQVTKSMAGVVKGMDATLKSMNLEKVQPHY